MMAKELVLSKWRRRKRGRGIVLLLTVNNYGENGVELILKTWNTTSLIHLSLFTSKLIPVDAKASTTRQPPTTETSPTQDKTGSTETST